MGVYSVGGRDERDVAVLILATHAIRMKLRPVVRSGRRTGQDRTACCVCECIYVYMFLCRLQIDGVGGALAKRCGRKLFMDYICWK